MRVPSKFPYRPGTHLAEPPVQQRAGPLVGLNEQADGPSFRGAIKVGNEQRRELLGGRQQRAHVIVVAELVSQINRAAFRLSGCGSSVQRRHVGSATGSSAADRCRSRCDLKPTRWASPWFRPALPPFLDPGPSAVPPCAVSRAAGPRAEPGGGKEKGWAKNRGNPGAVGKGSRGVPRTSRRLDRSN
jgi:hypothetical protein